MSVSLDEDGKDQAAETQIEERDDGDRAIGVGARSSRARKRLSSWQRAVLVASLGAVLAVGARETAAQGPGEGPLPPDAQPWVDLGQEMGNLVRPERGIFVPGNRGPVGEAAGDAYGLVNKGWGQAERLAGQLGSTKPVRDASRASQRAGQGIDRWVYGKTGQRLPVIGPQGGIYIPQGPPPGARPR